MEEDRPEQIAEKELQGMKGMYIQSKFSVRISRCSSSRNQVVVRSSIIYMHVVVYVVVLGANRFMHVYTSTHPLTSAVDHELFDSSKAAGRYN